MAECVFVRARLAFVAAAAVWLVAAASATGGTGPGDWQLESPLLPPSFRLERRGPDGGSIWIGRIPNRVIPSDHRLSAVYLPPGASFDRRYPVVYLLHGMSGSPSSYVYGMRLAETADMLISRGELRPFIAVIPVGGPMVHRDQGEWAGPWEDYLIEDVVPWTDRHLPTIPDRSARTLAGLSAGGYGAIDIGLRHPDAFGLLESWGGYFSPFRDGPFVHASWSVLAAHTPTMLVQARTTLLRDDGTRFFLSSGPSHGAITRDATISFAHELDRLGLPCRLLLIPLQERDAWRAQLAPGLLAADSADVGEACGRPL